MEESIWPTRRRVPRVLTLKSDFRKQKFRFLASCWAQGNFRCLSPQFKSLILKFPLTDSLYWKKRTTVSEKLEELFFLHAQKNSLYEICWPRGPVLTQLMFFFSPHLATDEDVLTIVLHSVCHLFPGFLLSMFYFSYLSSGVRELYLAAKQNTCFLKSLFNVKSLCILPLMGQLKFKAHNVPHTIILNDFNSPHSSTAYINNIQMKQRHNETNRCYGPNGFNKHL